MCVHAVYACNLVQCLKFRIMPASYTSAPYQIYPEIHVLLTGAVCEHMHIQTAAKRLIWALGFASISQHTHCILG